MKRGDKVKYKSDNSNARFYIFEPLLGQYYKIVPCQGSFEESQFGPKNNVFGGALEKVEDAAEFQERIF